MKVTLLNSYDSEDIAKLATANCVGRLDKPTDKGLQTAVNSGHYSVLEHLPLTFLIEDVSRVTEVQLVRHRIASYSIKSSRYTFLDPDTCWYVIPPVYLKTEELRDRYVSFMESAKDFYLWSIKHGIAGEDARYALPQAKSTNIVMSMNARAFIEQCTKRICKKAQWEIRDLFKNMRECIKDKYPTVYSEAVPLCVYGTCPEVKKCTKE